MSAQTEMTIDQLAARVGMTVRNVRAYAGRGLISPPRLVGRTGYYNSEHLARLQLIRDLIDRGYTLGAVEKALAEQRPGSAGHALDLLSVLSGPARADEPEEMSVDALTRLAGTERDEAFLGRLEEVGLIERLDADRVRLLRPVLVRVGAEALSLGLGRATVLALLDDLGDAVGAIAQRFVESFRADVWRPFLDAGMPEEEWPQVLRSIESLLPIASRAVVAAFRDELSTAVESALGEELGNMSGEQIGAMFGRDGD